MSGWVDPGVERVPFTLLGGYLGAGKTTIVNRLLADAGGRRIVVLVNDVGAVNVDAALIAEHAGPTLTLTNGCVCCAIDDDFGSTLETVRSLPERPDHVLMELSGVGEPARLAPWANTAGFRLDGIVVVVDAEQFRDQLERRYVGDTVALQVRSADLVLLTKTDLTPAQEGRQVRDLVASLSGAPVVPTADGVVTSEGLLEAVLGVGRTDAAPVEPPLDAPAVTGIGVRVIDVAGLDRRALDDALDELASTVVRAKGLTSIDGVTHEIQLVGRRRSVSPRPDLSGGDGQLVVIELPG